MACTPTHPGAYLAEGLAERKLGTVLRKLPTLSDRKPSGGTSFGLTTPEETS
jgi:hypothetical protein